MTNTEATHTRYEIRDRAAWITLDSPENRNALSAPLVTELGAHLRAALDDPAVRSIVLTGNGPAFCAGADLKNRGDAVAPGSKKANPFVEILRLMWDGPKPVIAAVNGHAFGGGIGLVAAADIAIAADSARFSFSEVRLGLIPAMISVVVLPKLGAHQTMRLFLTGERFSGYWWPFQLDEATQSWKKNRTWFCPTATQPLIDEHGNTAGRFTTFNAWGIYGQEHLGQLGPDGIAGSYGLNGYLLDPDAPPSHTFENGIQVADFWRTPYVQSASEIPLMCEALRFDVWPLYTDGPPAQESAAWSGSHMARSCVNRHNGAVNCLFADGSARKVGLKALWTLKWHRSFEMIGPWTKSGGVLPTDWPEWMRDFKDY